MLSTVEIFAGGDTGTEQFELLINDQVVETFSGVGSRGADREFVRFVHTTNEQLNGSDIQIRFINDEYRPAEGFDSNLYVSKIRIDGVTFQTESPSTFSTGIFRDGSETGPGFLEVEKLNINGSFYFSDDSSPIDPLAQTGTRIRIEALGSTGEEILELRIGGEVVSNFDVTNTESNASFFFVTDEIVSPEEIQVGFINDLFDPEAGIDRNLIVDQIQIIDIGSGDRLRFQSEAPTTFSTGTFTDEDGIVPGFGRGDTLHTNGFFSFATGGEVDSGPRDSSFGGDGFAEFDFDGIQQIGIRPDGRIVGINGSSDSIFSGATTTINVFNADGSRDQSFGNNGSISISGDNNDVSASLALQSDGSILIGQSNSFTADFTEVQRILTDGTIDPTFGDGGVLRLEGVRENRIAPTPDGGFLLIGNSGANFQGAVRKFTAQGSLDTGFGNNGILLLDPFAISGTSDDRVVVLDSGDALIQTGGTITKVTADGQLDTSFGNDGVAPINSLGGFRFPPTGSPGPFPTFFDFAVDSQGRIVASGPSELGGNRLARFNPDGSLDASFDQSAFDGQPFNEFFLDDQDRIVISADEADINPDGSVTEFSRIFFRLTPDGQIDSSFGDSGRIVEATFFDPPDLQTNTFFDVDLASDGSLIAATPAGLQRFVI